MMTRRSLARLSAAVAGAALLPRSTIAEGAGTAGSRHPEATDPHERTFMQWPVKRTVYDEADVPFDLQTTIAEIASTIAGFEPVELRAANAEAARLLPDLFPGGEIVTLNIDRVGEVGGGIHCATHEQPKVQNLREWLTRNAEPLAAIGAGATAFAALTAVVAFPTRSPRQTGSSAIRRRARFTASS